MYFTVLENLAEKDPRHTQSQSGTVTVVQPRAWVEGLGLQSAAGGWDCCGTGIAVPCRGQGLFMIGDCSPEPKKGTDRDLRTGYG